MPRWDFPGAVPKNCNVKEQFPAITPAAFKRGAQYELEHGNTHREHVNPQFGIG
jgi:hypothetical protein